MNRKAYRILVFSFFSVLLVVGIVIGFYFENKKNIEKEKVLKISNKDKEKNEDITLDVSSKDIKVDVYTDDITVEIIYKYLLCEHEIKESLIEYQTSMELVKSKYKNYNIISEENNILKLCKDVRNNCPNHFLIKVLNEDIVIYKIVDNNKNQVFKNTEIHINTVRDEIKEELKKGIYVTGIQELNQIIEEFES